jgi:hypothetical protein
MDREEMAEFLESGITMLGASADEHGRPEAFRVWGATLDNEGRLRALVNSDAGRTLESVRAGRPIAFVFTDITTFASLQVKGRVHGGPEAPGPSDAAVMRRYSEAFTAALAKIGHPARLAERLRPLSVFAVRVTLDEQYDQTPGPSAGVLLEAATDG